MPAAHRLVDRIDDGARRMTQERRTLAEQVVHVVVAVDVPQPGALASGEEHAAPVEPDVGVDATR